MSNEITWCNIVYHHFSIKIYHKHHCFIMYVSGLFYMILEKCLLSLEITRQSFSVPDRSHPDKEQRMRFHLKIAFIQLFISLVLHSFRLVVTYKGFKKRVSWKLSRRRKVRISLTTVTYSCIFTLPSTFATYIFNTCYSSALSGITIY